MGRPSNTAVRRAEIVAGLLSVMARVGYQRATIPEVARAAGLTPGLVHYHFRSKHQVLVALVVHLAEGLRTRLARRLALAGDTPRERLAALVDAHLALGDDADPRAVAAWVVVGTEAVRDAEVRALYQAEVRASLQGLRRLVRACLAADGRKLSAAPGVAAAILSMIEGAYRLGLSAPDALPRGFAAPMVRQALEGLLGPRGRR